MPQGDGASVYIRLRFIQSKFTDTRQRLNCKSLVQLNQVDVLQGSRHKDGTALDGGMPVYKKIAGKCLTWLENRVFGLHLTDYHSGYMLYSRKAVANLPLQQLSSSFDFDVEVIAASRRRGLKIDEQGIPTHYGDEESHLNPISYGFRVLHVLWRYKRGYYDPR